MQASDGGEPNDRSVPRRRRDQPTRWPSSLLGRAMSVVRIRPGVGSGS